MKNKALIIISSVSLILAAAAIQILPDQIPVHYGIGGNADRTGSKYEVFLFTVIIIALSAISILLRRKFEKDGLSADGGKESTHASDNAKICGKIFTAVCAVVLGMECVMICIGYSGLEQITGTEGELYCSVTVILVGILFAVLGNIMPKMKMSGLMGLRTEWSMKNDEVWARCQRMGGTLMFFGGVAIILSGIVLRGYPSLIAMMMIFTVILAVSVKGSHQVYKDWEKEHQ